MSFLGLAVYAGMDAEYTGGTRSAAQYYEETNLAVQRSLTLDGTAPFLGGKEEYVYYTSGRNELVSDYAAFGYAFLPSSCYPGEDEQEIYDTLQIDVGQKIKKEEENDFKEKLKAALDKKDLLVADRTQNSSYASFKSEMDQHFVFSFLFPAVFLMIAFLGIVTTMTRMTANQRTQVGTWNCYRGR